MSDSYLEMTGYMIPDKLIPSRVGVIPIGSIEYHGPHLPLGTDSLIALDMSRRVAEELDAVVLPLVAYTGEYWTKGFQGTISIDGRVFINYLVEILRGALRSGLGGILMMGAHGENAIFCPEAGRLVADEFPDKKVMFANWWDPVPNSVLVDELKLFPFEVIGCHGGGAEVTITARIAPHAVDVSKAEKERELKRPWDPLQYFRPTEMKPALDFAGYWGPTQVVDHEKGEIILRESARRIAAACREVMAGK